MLHDPLKDCLLYDGAEVESLYDAMAARAAPLLAGAPAAIVGILRRGGPIAQALRTRLSRDHGIVDLRFLELRIERYADDLTVVHPETLLTEDPAHGALDFSGRRVLLVDDVLYRGHSMLRAIGWAVRHGAAEVRTAVLADRRATRIPVFADVVGAHLQVAADDVVECHVPPYEPALSIRLVRPRR